MPNHLPKTVRRQIIHVINKKTNKIVDGIGMKLDCSSEYKWKENYKIRVTTKEIFI